MISNKASFYDFSGRIDDSARVDDFCILTGSVSIDHHTHIGPFSILSAKNGKIKIGKYCGISSRVSIYTGTENFLSNKSGNPTVDQSLRDVTYSDVHIEDYVLIGSGVIILPGVKIGEGASISAGSVITKNIPSCAIVGPSSKLKIYGYRELHSIKKDLK